MKYDAVVMKVRVCRYPLFSKHLVFGFQSRRSHSQVDVLILIHVDLLLGVIEELFNMLHANLRNCR